MQDELREKLIRLLEGMESPFAVWRRNEVGEVADYILSQGGRRTVRELVKMAEEGYPVVNQLAKWINSWDWEKMGSARSRMARIYLRSWEWNEVLKGVDTLLRRQVAHSKAAALGYLALIGARVLREKGLEKAVCWLLSDRGD